MSATLEQAERITGDAALAEETLLDELEEEDIPAHIREARLGQLKRMTADLREKKDRKHGLYSDIQDERAFLEITTTDERCIIHFFHADFRRCAIMDGHLERLAVKHFNSKFARISVETAKFCVTKLKIQVLPAVFCFIKGIVVDRIIGFDELGEGGEGDDFPTEALERRLMRSGVIVGTGGGSGGLARAPGGTGGPRGRAGGKEAEDSDDENDW